MEGGKGGNGGGEKLDRRVRELEVKGEEKEGKGRKVNEREGRIEEKIRGIENRLEKKEREERRKNIVTEEIKVKEGNRKDAVEGILKSIGVEAKIEELRRLGKNEERGTEMIWVKLENEEQKKEVLEKKKNLKSRRKRIVEDLTWKERKMRWKLENIARGRRGEETGCG